MPFDDKADKATIIQRWWRGHQIRKKYGVTQLPTNALRSSRTFLVGNDPKIEELDKHTFGREKIALVGTSGLRSLSLALALSQSPTVPKIIIIDNAQEVVTFWRKLRGQVEESKFTDQAQFIEKFAQFLRENHELYNPLPPERLLRFNTSDFQYENQDPLLYVNQLITTYGLERVLNTIKYTSIFQQTWTDPSLFAKLKNICELNGIAKVVAYPSNIASCVVETDKVFESIERLSPDLSILTDRCPVHELPEHVTLTKEKRAEELKTSLLEQSRAPSERVVVISPSRRDELLLLIQAILLANLPPAPDPSFSLSL